MDNGRWRSVIGRVIAAFVILVLSLSGIAALAAFLWWLLNRLGEEPAAELVEIEIDDRAPGVDVAVPDEEPDPPLQVETKLPEPEAKVDGAGQDIGAEEAGEEAQDLVEEEADVGTIEAEAGEPEPTEPAPEVEPDDLKRIEGIGPKISSILQDAGISTYAQLASAEVTALEQILEKESPRLLRIANPTTWPEQAKLAEVGDWDALKAMQGSFRRGRRA
jgi:predicted flap endonuclease-1-like 5' DNA nuclease